MTPILYRGETKNIVLDLTDANGAAQDVTGYTDARAAISRSADSSPYVTKTGGDVSVTPDPASVTIALTQAESEGLPLGLVYVQVWVEIGGTWVASQQVALEVRRGIGAPE